MAQHVVKVRGAIPDAPSTDLLDYFSDYRAVTTSAGPSGELRESDSAEMDGVADTLASLRDSLGLPDVVTYHVCRHDEGLNDCAATVEVR